MKVRQDERILRKSPICQTSQHPPDPLHLNTHSNHSIHVLSQGIFTSTGPPEAYTTGAS